MTEKTIQKALRGFAQNHDYKLENTYVFAWESDFFSITKTGTVYEYEIKISKADFKKDFGKPKHLFFQSVFEKKTHLVKAEASSKWRFEKTARAGKYLNGELDVEDRWYHKAGRYGGYVKPDLQFTDAEDSFGYWHQWDNWIRINQRINEVHWPYTEITIIKLEEKKMPGKFFYVCPEGLIKPELVPAYAGLIYVHKNGLTAYVVKNAPFLHKNGMDGLGPVLLDKFHWLSVNQRYHNNSLCWKIINCQDLTEEQRADAIRAHGL